MRNIIWFFALLILLLIQGGILLPLSIAPVSLILVVVAIATLLSDFDQGLVITLLGGLLVDLISGLPDGLISMSLIVVFLLMHLILNEVLSREPNHLILGATVAGSTILYFLVFLGVDKLFGFIGLVQTQDVQYLFGVLLPLTLMWNLIFAYPVFKYYSWIQNLASKVRPDEEPIRT